jgi:hypothetical protein
MLEGSGVETGGTEPATVTSLPSAEGIPINREVTIGGELARPGAKGTKSNVRTVVMFVANPSGALEGTVKSA